MYILDKHIFFVYEKILNSRRNHRDRKNLNFEMTIILIKRIFHHFFIMDYLNKSIYVDVNYLNM